MRKASSNNQSDITTALGSEGLGEQSWWVEQWMELINSYRYKKRLERAWKYAREGNVTSIRFEGRRVHARVQGTGEEPYKIKLWLDVLQDEDWGYVLEALSKKARWSAQLLAGIMPTDIERAFAASGRRLFPFKLQEVKSECNCPDKANPCKHISAIYYLMGDRFEEDPFILFQLRGRSRSQLLSDLSKERLKVISALSQSNGQSGNNLAHQDLNKSQHMNIHPAIEDPKLWWEYNNDLHSDLVVITPSMEEEKGLKAAGDLPLAKDPKHPESLEIFLKSLYKHGETSSQHAMIKAMTNEG